MLSDPIDLKILKVLSRDASLSSKKLGEQVGLSTAATNERVRKLKANGVITSTVAVVNPAYFKDKTLAFIRLKLNNNQKNLVIDKVLENPNVEEIHSITGGFSLLVKIRVESNAMLEDFFADIYSLEAVISSETDIVFTTYISKPPLVGAGVRKQKTQTNYKD